MNKYILAICHHIDARNSWERVIRLKIKIPIEEIERHELDIADNRHEYVYDRCKAIYEEKFNQYPHSHSFELIAFFSISKTEYERYAEDCIDYTKENDFSL